jgi:nucleoside-diphosphate-sugar epimerase
MKRILVTGSTGFIGSALMRRLDYARQFVVSAASRDCLFSPVSLSGIDTIVHLAARVHITEGPNSKTFMEFRRVNTEGTLNLARQAAAAGVKRFIFTSSVKVNGEGKETPYRETDAPSPEDSYAVSKHEAEIGLREIAAKTQMEVVIIRPPLVYGAGVKANFHSLMRAVARGIPLPLAAIHNRRSFIALDNLVDFILTCIKHPAAAHETFLVSDGEDLSTADLIRKLARAMGRKPHLFSVPVSLLKGSAALLGKNDLARRLCSSLQIDITKARQTLAWNPPISVDEALSQAVKHYL